MATLKSRPTAVVTGAGQGIGQAIALELAKAGYHLGLQGRSQVRLQETAQRISGEGSEAFVCPGDVTDPASADVLVEGAAAAFSPVEVAVSCAGQAYSAPLMTTDAEVFRRLFEVNVMAVLHLMKAAAGHMMAHGRPGRIVVIASTAAVRGARYTSAYATSKHAAAGLVKSAAAEWTSHGITVNAVCPGWVDTPMFDETLARISEKTGRSPERARERIETQIPSGRVTQSEEVASLVRFLVSPRAAQVTGQCWVMDGGEGL
ncbi:MAG: SDR family NAD(P)-dependent oxidoreductase [Myxococcota bacterium]